MATRVRGERLARAGGVAWFRGMPALALRALARPGVVGLCALAVYLARAHLSPTGFARTPEADFNYLADAFLHGRLSLRLLPPSGVDLVHHAGRVHLYWPPFPALVVLPLVALWGVGVSDVLYTAVLAAVGVALLARFLRALDETGVAPLAAERRGLLVLGIAWGSVLLILAPVGRVWFTAQVVGWVCVLLAAIAALTLPGPAGYALAGLALACAAATRLQLAFVGVWLAYYLWRRDRAEPRRRRVALALTGLTPLALAAPLLAWYNLARFGNPLEMGLAWHAMNPFFSADYARYGAFSLHYLPTNLHYQFVAYDLRSPRRWLGEGLFWTTPLLLAAPYAAWRGRRDPLTWALVASCALVYAPIGLLMGTGWITFGPRYLLDLFAPLLVLAARGLARWPLVVVTALALVGCATYLYGSWLWLELQRGLAPVLLAGWRA